MAIRFIEQGGGPAFIWLSNTGTPFIFTASPGHPEAPAADQHLIDELQADVKKFHPF